jgi:excisionase family DNA binding protein
MKFSPKIEPQYLDLKGLARYSSLSVGTLRVILARPGGPPHYRPGGKVLIKRSDWDHWLEQFKTAPVDLGALVEEVLSEIGGRKAK